MYCRDVPELNSARIQLDLETFQYGSAHIKCFADRNYLGTFQALSLNSLDFQLSLVWLGLPKIQLEIITNLLELEALDLKISESYDQK